MGVVGETTTASMALNLVRASAPLETLKKLQTAPVAFTDVNLYNPLSGYASYIVAAVMPIIIQAVMFVSIVMSLGDGLRAQIRLPCCAPFVATYAALRPLRRFLAL